MSVVVLTGGVGGAKLVRGLTLMDDAPGVTAIVNTGDDFRHFGLHVSPDIDTVLYTLSGKANRVQGWGREDETWTFMEAMRSLGGADWFLLGDGDLALHVLRTARLADGERLSAITNDFAVAWGVGARILPMSDQPVATRLETDEGRLEFQHYFVRRRCAPKVREIWFEGAARAAPAPGVVEAILQAHAVLIAPSNPYLSVDPILAVPGVSEALRTTPAPVVAISPLIGGQAVKGPTVKLMTELGAPLDNRFIAEHYQGIIDGLLIDAGDEAPSADLMIARADIMMRDDGDRIRVAQAALQLAKAAAT